MKALTGLVDITSPDIRPEQVSSGSSSMGVAW
jgi:hypothetical protein